MELTFTLSEDDYVRAGRAILHRKVGGWLLYLFLLLCAFVGLAAGLLPRDGPHFGPIAFGTGMFLAALFIWYSPLTHVRGTLRGHTEAFASQSWRIDASGVDASGPASASSFAWCVVLKLLEDGEYLYFYVSEGNAIILPKRAVPPALMPALRDDLRSWLGTRARLDRWRDL